MSQQFSIGTVFRNRHARRLLRNENTLMIRDQSIAKQDTLPVMAVDGYNFVTER